MENYKLKDFAKWARKVRISDQNLSQVIMEMNRGLLGDRLGANVYKKRVKIDGRGKSAGGRVVILYKNNNLSLFLYGFLKNEQENISRKEEQQLRVFANEFIKLSVVERIKLIAEGKLIAIEE